VGEGGARAPSFETGFCDRDRTHLSTLTVRYEIPEAANASCERSPRTGGCAPRIIQLGIKYDF
jgi:hypothetical protein